MKSSHTVIKRVTPLTRLLETAQPETVNTLKAVLFQGLAEYEAADSNDVWNVTARLWLASGQFTFSDRDGHPGLGQECFPSELILEGDQNGLLRMTSLGHADVVVLIPLVPYIRTAYELSVHALASALLNEAQRVINLGLTASDDVHSLLQARDQLA